MEISRKGDGMETEVHYYSFHIKDYHLATAHLTTEEDCCYRRILDLYYDTEGAIGEATQVARRVRMPTPLVEQILSEFFDKSENGWANARADKEISGYQRMANGGKKGAIARWNREGNGEAMPTPSQPQCQPVTSNHEPVTIDKDITSLTDEDKPNGCPSCPIEEVISIYHEALPTNPKVRVRTAARDKQIVARWKQFYQEGDFKDREGGLNCFRWYFDQVKISKFLTGQTDKPFMPDLEWLTKASNFAKVIEGKYHGNR